MMYHLRAFCKGYVVLKVTPNERGYAWIFDLLQRENIPFWGQKRYGDFMTFCILSSDAHRLQATPEAAQIIVLAHRGIGQLLSRYRRRIGIPIGLFAFCVMLFLSGKFVWRVDVSGAENVPKEEIIAKLEEIGCSVGSYIPDLDGYRLSKMYLSCDPRISWIAVNVVGNVVHVSVRETVSPPPKEALPQAANLVAREDGVIVSYALTQGQSVMQIGNAVQKGDLLVSGLCENKVGSYTLTCANGKVYARVLRTLSVEIPCEVQKTVRTGVKKTEKMIKIFGKTIKFSKTSRNSEAKYDTIRSRKELTLFSRIVLPITYETITYYETETITEIRSQAQTQAIAKEELDARFSALQTEAKEILSVSDPILEETPFGCRMTMQVECVVDIAQMQEVKLP